VVSTLEYRLEQAMTRAVPSLGLLLLAAVACVSGPPPYFDPGPRIPEGAHIVYGNSDHCIRVQGGVPNDGTPMILSPCGGGFEERWFLSGGQIAQGLGSCLDVQGSAAKESAQIIVVKCYGGPSQHWGVVDGQIIGIGGKCITPLAGNTVNGTPLVLLTCASIPPGQSWIIQ
jgi:hypothetical protein